MTAPQIPYPTFSATDRAETFSSKLNNFIRTLYPMLQRVIWLSAPIEFIAPTLLNSWVDYGLTLTGAGYYKDPLGLVRLRGLIKNGTAAGGTALFVLPEGYRPAADLVFPSVSFNGAALVLTSIDVFSDGNVKIGGTGASNNYLTLSGVSFAASPA